MPTPLQGGIPETRMMDKLLFTAEEAGEILSLSRTVVYELIAKGLLESVAVGRARRIPAEALYELVETLRQGVGTREHRSGKIGFG